MRAIALCLAGLAGLLSLPASAQDRSENKLVIPKAAGVDAGWLMLAWSMNDRDCEKGGEPKGLDPCPMRDALVVGLEAMGWCRPRLYWVECENEPIAEPEPAPTAPKCSNLIGWDPEKKREICGPAIVPATAADMAKFKARWQIAANRVGNRGFLATCGLYPHYIADRDRSTVEGRMMTDPEFRRLSDMQRRQLFDWYRNIALTTGKGKPCPVLKDGLGPNGE